MRGCSVHHLHSFGKLTITTLITHFERYYKTIEFCNTSANTFALFTLPYLISLLLVIMPNIPSLRYTACLLHAHFVLRTISSPEQYKEKTILRPICVFHSYYSHGHYPAIQTYSLNGTVMCFSFYPKVTLSDRERQ